MWENVKDFIITYFTLVVFICLMFICLMVYLGFKVLRKFDEKIRTISQLHSNVIKDSESLQTIVINLHSEFYTIKKTDLESLIAKHVKLQWEQQKKEDLKNKINKAKSKDKTNGISKDVYSKEMKEIKILSDDDGIVIKKNVKDDIKDTKKIITFADEKPYVTGWMNRINLDKENKNEVV